MNILIISNQQTFAQQWKTMLESIQTDVSVVITSLDTLKNYLNVHEAPDFLMIETDDVRDLKTIAALDCPSPLLVVATDASLCLQAFQYNTFNYLIKPITAEDAESSIEKYKKFYLKKSDSEFLGNLQSLVKFVSKQEKDYKKRFMIKVGNTIKSIAVKEIAYFYSQDKINYIMRNDGKKYPVENTLDEIEDMLNPENFYRANRQYIININAISEIHPYFKGRVKLNLTPQQENELIISSEKSRSFKDWLDN